MNRKLLCAVLACGAATFATGAIAADLPSSAPAPAPYIAPPPVFTWTGFYLGINEGWVGVADGGIHNTSTDTGAGGLGAARAAGAIPTNLNVDDFGFLGGGQVGYNWQNGSLVLGAVADFDWSNARDSFLVGPLTVPGFVPITSRFDRNLEWLSTFRARLGFTVTPTLLLYATGGLALGQTELGNEALAATALPPLAALSKATNTSAGWTIGAGAEWMFAPHWTVSAEYLYADLGRHSTTISYAYAANTSTLTTSANDSFNIARLGLNYKF